MVKKLAIIREIFKRDHNAVAARKLRRNQISALCMSVRMFIWTHHKDKQSNNKVVICTLNLATLI